MSKKRKFELSDFPKLTPEQLDYAIRSVDATCKNNVVFIALDGKIINLGTKCGWKSEGYARMALKRHLHTSSIEKSDYQHPVHGNILCDYIIEQLISEKRLEFVSIK